MSSTTETQPSTPQRDEALSAGAQFIKFLGESAHRHVSTVCAKLLVLASAWAAERDRIAQEEIAELWAVLERIGAALKPASLRRRG